MKQSVVQTHDCGTLDERLPEMPGASSNSNSSPYVAPELCTLKHEIADLPTQPQPRQQVQALLSMKQAARRTYAQQVAAQRLSLGGDLGIDAQSEAIEEGIAGGDEMLVMTMMPGAADFNVYPLAKRAFDLLVSAFALIGLLPLFFVIAIAIVIDDPGPVLYYQPRMGKDGRVFRFYKFRSMCRDADSLKPALHEHNEANGGIFKMRNDPRVTPIGRVLRRYSLDELPQLISVLRGDMSLIGPRPMVVEEAGNCDSRQWQRHAVRPGLLCLREICGRSCLSFDEWVELDLLYVACQSFAIDLKILLCSLPAIVSSEHAY